MQIIKKLVAILQKKIAAVVAVAVIVIVIVGGYAAWMLSNKQNPVEGDTPYWIAPNPTMGLSLREQIRDASMEYIKTNHPQTTDLMTNLSWTGGRVQLNLVGSETYMYTCTGWVVIVHNPVVADPEYTVTANYLAPGMNTVVNWVGTYKDGNITETSYTDTMRVYT